MTNVEPDVYFENSENLLPIVFGLETRLYFAAIVELTAIPLYLLIKPHLDVWTDDEKTQQWLANCLLRDSDEEMDIDGSPASTRSPWWSCPAQQSDHGILLEVRNRTSTSRNPDLVITEFLVYAAVCQSTETLRYCSSPPPSSPPTRLDEAEHDNHKSVRQKIEIRAIPINSTAHQLHCADQVDRSLTISQPPKEEVHVLPTASATAAALSDSPENRQRMSNLFADAKIQRKRFNRRGGECVSKAMAFIDSPTPPLAKKQGSEPDASKINSQIQSHRQLGGRALSRACSTSSLHGLEQPRPQLRPQRYSDATSSSLHGTENMTSSGDSPNVPTPTSNFEEQNRLTLTRIVMAGMRIYGLQQRRKSVKLSTGFEPGPDLPSNDLGGGDDEYKMIYHQTVKAATFTFRNQMKSKSINQAAMGEVVDQLLAMFCSDPSTVHHTMDSFNSCIGKKAGT